VSSVDNWSCIRLEIDSYRRPVFKNIYNLNKFVVYVDVHSRFIHIDI